MAQDESKRAEELKRRIDQLKRKAIEEETQRIEQEVELRGKEIAAPRLEKERAIHQQNLKTAESERQGAEESLKQRQDEIVKKIVDERRRKEEIRRRELEEKRRKEEEERKRREETERKRREEEARIKAEAERQRLEQEAKQREEEQRRRAEEEIRRREEERKVKNEEERRRLEEEIRQKEEERRKLTEEKEHRIISLIASARVFFENKEYENAAVEIAKALVNDPNHPEALELEEKIREAQGKTIKEVVVEEVVKKREVVPPKTREDVPVKRKTVSVPLVIAGIVVIIGVVAVLFLQVKKRVFEKPPTFAVIPWKSATDNSQESVLGFSLAEEVTEQFQHMPKANVMGFSSAYGLVASPDNSEKAIFRLGYEYVLEGALTETNDGLTVELRLVDSLKNVTWTHRFEQKKDRIAELPGEISRQLAQMLTIPLRADSVKPTDQHIVTNGDAYITYLMGLEKLYYLTNRSTKEALDLFNQSIGQDHQFSDALAAAANVQMTRIEKGWDAEDKTLLQAKQWADQAFTVQPASGAAHLASGRVMARQREFTGALKAFDLAAENLPNSGEIYLNKARVFIILGKYTEAIDALHHASDLNPRDPEILSTFALAHQLNGSVEEGFWYHITVLYFVPDSTEYLAGPFANAILFDPGISLWQSSRVADACKRRFEANPNDYISMYRLARMLQVNGDFTGAVPVFNDLEKLLRNLLQEQPKNTDIMMYLALTLTRMGKYPEATVLATKALEVGGNNVAVKYKIAQINSVQMYSQKKKEIDPKKKEDALKALHDAVETNFDIGEITDADFYNLSSQPEFHTAIIR